MSPDITNTFKYGEHIFKTKCSSNWSCFEIISDYCQICSSSVLLHMESPARSYHWANIWELVFDVVVHPWQRSMQTVHRLYMRQ